MDVSLMGVFMSGVKVFIVFVFLGSLFLLIYNIGWKWMNVKNFYFVSEVMVFVIFNFSILCGYFSYFKDKFLVCYCSFFLMVVMDEFFFISSFEGEVSLSDCIDCVVFDVFVGDEFSGFVKNFVFVIFWSFYFWSYDVDIGFYMVICSYSLVF